MSQVQQTRLPEFKSSAYDCPHCGAYSHQRWLPIMDGVGFETQQVDGLDISLCAHCGASAVWRGGVMVYPAATLGPAPHDDMPTAVRCLYEEARGVGHFSRRSAAALLRLALQVLVDDLDPGPGAINDKIGRLVGRGLDQHVQRAMDVVRVVGNNAVHPGRIDLDGDESLVPSLFSLVNVVVEQMIARPKMVEGLFKALPADALAAISRRDGVAS